MICRLAHDALRSDSPVADLPFHFARVCIVGCVFDARPRLKSYHFKSPEAWKVRGFRSFGGCEVLRGETACVGGAVVYTLLACWCVYCPILILDG